MTNRFSRGWNLATPLLLALVVMLVLGYPTSSGTKKELVEAQGDQSMGRDKMKRDREIAKMVGDVDEDDIEDSVEKLVSFGTRNTLSSQTDPVRGIGAARDWIFNEFQSYVDSSDGRLTVEKQSFLQEEGLPQPTVITNVVATLRGTQAESVDRFYVVSGHYDSRCSNTNDAVCDAPGANDDASGVAGVLEMARVMSKYEHDATVVFMAVAGEEQGLMGSEFFAEQAVQNDQDIQGMFTNDIIGNSVGGNGIVNRKQVRLFNEGVPTNETPQEAARRRSIGGENDGRSRQLARYIDIAADAYTKDFDVWLLNRRDRFNRGGDQIPFLERGYPAVRFTEPNEDFTKQHQNVRVEDGVQFGDLIEFVDFDYIEDVTRVNVASLASLARGPGTPENARIQGGLSNDTVLSWDASTESDLKGYEVVWRDTTAVQWTHFRFVGDVTTYTLENISKDNFMFGVRAIDEDGHESPVAFPRP